MLHSATHQIHVHASRQIVRDSKGLQPQQPVRSLNIVLFGHLWKGGILLKKEKLILGESLPAHINRSLFAWLQMQCNQTKLPSGGRIERRMVPLFKITAGDPVAIFPIDSIAILADPKVLPVVHQRYNLGVFWRVARGSHRHHDLRRLNSCP